MTVPVLSPGALAFCGQRLTAYRHFWRSSLISSVLEPALFLASMGLTLGILVDRGPGLPGGVSYLSFLAPGLLAAAAMQTGSFESTYPVLGAIKWDKTYDAVLATPTRVGDLLVGQLLYVAFRVTTSAALFLAVLVLFGAADSWLVVLAVPAALLTGMAFAAPITAYAATLDNDSGFAAVQRFLIIPMFLFSGTFFPISAFPVPLQWLVECTPLYRSVVLCRELTTGSVTWGSAVSVVYLAVLGLAGLAVVRRRLDKLLLS